MAAELILIGIGLDGINGMTVDAINAAKNADFRFYESYTALWSDDALDGLKNEIGDISTVMRPEIEMPEKILNLAKEHSVAVLVVGDPLQATTHVDLQVQAIENGVDCKVIHGISITGLVTGAVGLSNYKFGRQTTLTYPYNGWVATSPLEVIALNKIQNLHTLVLLDLDPTGEGIGQQKPMQPQDAKVAFELMAERLDSGISDFANDSNLDLLKIEACRKICENIDDMPVVLCTDMGGKNQAITYTAVKGLESCQNGGLHCIIVPANLSDVEETSLSRWSKE